MTQRHPALGLAFLLVTVISVPTFSVTAAKAEVVRVVIDQIYQYRKPSKITYEEIEGFELPILDLVEDMMFAADHDVIYADDPDQANAVITISVRGRALGTTYLEPVKSFLYTGAQIDGRVELEMADGTSATSNFLSETQRQFRMTINLGYEDPRNAPFTKTLELSGGFVESVARVMAETWGISSIVPSLYENEPTIRASVAKLLGDVGDSDVAPDLIDVLEFDDSERARWEAAWSLGRIGNEQAIPALIEALNDTSDDVRWFSSWSLRNITGEDYGPSHETWSDWWAGQEMSVEG